MQHIFGVCHENCFRKIEFRIAYILSLFGLAFLSASGPDVCPLATSLALL